MTRLILIYCSFLVPIAFSSPQTTEWHGIRPLNSTRADVEKLIGPPLEPNGITYDLPDERVNITYSESACTKGWPYGWNVRPGTVISIMTYPKSAQTISSLPFDLSGFDSKFRQETQRLIYYNDEQGITIEADVIDQRIRSIQYLPRNKDQHLRCPEAAAREKSIASGESANLTPTFYYSELPPGDRQLQLDHLTEKLKAYSAQSIIFIIAYGDTRLCPNDAQRQIDWAKNYLTSKRKIPLSRIRTIDGGYRDRRTVELFIVAPGKPIPLSSPDVYPGDSKETRNCDQH